jgi:hypothetical protein
MFEFSEDFENEIEQIFNGYQGLILERTTALEELKAIERSSSTEGYNATRAKELYDIMANVRNKLIVYGHAIGLKRFINLMHTICPRHIITINPYTEYTDYSCCESVSCPPLNLSIGGRSLYRFFLTVDAYKKECGCYRRNDGNITFCNACLIQHLMTSR